MRIGVLSDTHLTVPNATLDYVLDELFAETDMILHAGDIVSMLVLERLEERGVVAVCGNMDDHEVAGRIPQHRVIPVEGIRIALIHGWGSKDGLERRILARFVDDKPDLIVYGHSHVPFWERRDGVYLFNPGSAAQGRYSTGTVGMLEIVGGSAEGRILSLTR